MVTWISTNRTRPDHRPVSRRSTGRRRGRSADREPATGSARCDRSARSRSRRASGCASCTPASSRRLSGRWETKTISRSKAVRSAAGPRIRIGARSPSSCRMRPKKGCAPVRRERRRIRTISSRPSGRVRATTASVAPKSTTAPPSRPWGSVAAVAPVAPGWSSGLPGSGACSTPGAGAPGARRSAVHQDTSTPRWWRPPAPASTAVGSDRGAEGHRNWPRRSTVSWL